MLNLFARGSVSRLTDPLGAALVRLGLSPNAVTVLGAAGSSAAAVWFFPRGQLFVGTVVVVLFLLFDLLDGAMARAGSRATPFGGVLDATCDRVADGALFAALAWWALVTEGDRALGAGLLSCLVCAQVISYVRARAEANGLRADGGIAERAERFLVVLGGAGLHGLGVPYVFHLAVWVLVVLSVITVAQRLSAVHRGGGQ